MNESTFASNSHLGQERHHIDPPQLWIGAIAGSIIIHAIAFFMLRSLLFTEKAAASVNQTAIPIEIVTNSPEITDNNTKASSPLQRKVAKPTVTTTASEINAQIASPQSKQPQVVVTPKSQKIAQKPPEKQKAASSAKKQTEKASQRQQAQLKEEIEPTPLSPDTATKKPNELETTSPQQTTNNSESETETQPGETVVVETNSDSETVEVETNSNEAGETATGIMVTAGAYRLTDPSRDVPDKLAQIRQNRISVPSEEIQPLGINVERVVQVEVVVLIQPTGEATVVGSPRILQGSITVDAAQVLATQIVQRMEFEPTYMGTSAVAQAYYLPLTISPSGN
ncbi:MAG: hypothetical protein SAJ37_01705 [Oscillatoria sp. PMC 1068.18]|nr:hypothetical protein [Oscillatoria sp. PMC 1076.18]MEC4987438.1 hypothetical protein [Oscillatoria sp. PMC 1068.18]